MDLTFLARPFHPIVAPVLSVFAPSLGALGVALLVDFLVGEPPNALHPVSWMGRLIARLTAAAPARGPLRQLLAGALIAVVVPASSVLLAALLLRVLASYPWLAFIAGALLLKTMFALRALGSAAARVRDALSDPAGRDLPGARTALRSLCSRPADRLDEPALAAATIESVAENLSDSFVAPLFYYALFGLPGAVAYRAVNTLDAMIGYHGRYEYLGKAAARLDDLLNLIPARLTALLLLLGAALGGQPAARGWRILRRDGAATESPNAGRPMAAMAGVLGVALEKSGHYRLGDADRPVVPALIAEAWHIVRRSAGLATAAAALLLLARNALIR